jgi:O-antigen ligase
MELLIAIAVIGAAVAVLGKTDQLSLPSLALLTVLAAIAFGHPFWNVQLGPFPLTLDRIVVLAMLIAFPVLVWNRRAELKPVGRTDLLVLLMAGLLLVSTFLHDWSYRENLPLSRLIFFNLLPFCFYFLARNSLPVAGQLGGFYWLLTGAGFCFAVVAVFEEREWYGLVFPRYIIDPSYVEFLGRARGPFLNPVSLGIFLGTGILGAAALWRGATPLTKTFLAAAIMVMISASFLTYTRSVWMGCAASLAILFWFPSTMKTRGAMVAAGSLVVAMLVFSFADKVTRFQRDKNVSEAEMAQSAALRPMLARVAWKMFLDKPLLGHGYGQYTATKRPYHFNDQSGQPLSKILPYMQHNVFLSFLTETGSIGMLLLIFLIAAAMLTAWRTWNSEFAARRERFAGLVLMAFLVNYVINGMFHDVSIIDNVHSLFFLLAGTSANVLLNPETPGV